MQTKRFAINVEQYSEDYIKPELTDEFKNQVVFTIISNPEIAVPVFNAYLAEAVIKNEETRKTA